MNGEMRLELFLMLINLGLITLRLIPLRLIISVLSQICVLWCRLSCATKFLPNKNTQAGYWSKIIS